ncbi:HAMP domain-containing sensor histidine kinase [Streptomyces sp. NPDC005438]|uniref:sensor histidine kinase n=1 Tax=Streptomyces sp. NPDC005438 TaxID=3156880 RepID=UPI0033B2FEDD
MAGTAEVPSPGGQPPKSPPPKPAWDPRGAKNGKNGRNGHPDEGRLRPTIRIRLTLLYGGLFLMAGVILLVIIYLLTAQTLNEGASSFRVYGGYDLRLSSDNCPAVSQATNINEFNRILDACQEAQRSAVLNSLMKRSLLCLLGLTVLAFAAGYMVAGRVLSPIGRITRTAQGVVSSDLHKRIDLDGPDDELKELADTFDEMLDRLDRAFNAQQRFVANASHELRTPLAINRTLLEVQMADPEVSPELSQLGKTLLATNERSEQLVEGLLLLARSENENIERKPVDLSEVASQAVELVRPEAEQKGIELRGIRQPAYVMGNGVLLERVAQNLVQNAVRYNVCREDSPWVEVTTEAREGFALLTVSNTGPQVPAYEVDNLFEPFRRLRTERTGSDRGVGLGLSIVRSVATAHGGRVSAEPRENGGLVVRVTLPVQ